MPILDRLFKLREESDEVKPFLEHLEDFRFLLMKVAAALLTCMMASLFFRKDLVDILQRPLNSVDPSLSSKLQVLGVGDTMTISFQLAFYAGLVLAFPLLLFFLAQFILPALTRKEKKYVLPAIGVGFGLFLSGVAFCYFIILPQTLAFFFNDAKSLNWTPMWTVREYFSFVTQITISFGLAFELPVAVLILVAMGFVTHGFLARTRPYAVVLILILAAVIAPTTDVLTFICLGLPMCALYEACIWLAWFIDRRRQKNLQNPPTIET
jgi:sec-independent protein translocase protein TatC